MTVKDQPNQSTSVILPCHEPSKEELDSIAFCLRELARATFAEVLVVEQVAPDGTSTLRGVIDSLGDSRFCLIEVRLDDPLLFRTRLCNEGARLASGHYLWLHDPHLVLPFEEIAQALALSASDAIKPFGSYVKLSRHDTAAFVAGGTLHDPIIRHGKRLGTAMGKTSLVMNREVYLALGGMQQRLVGPSDEGFELVRRLKKRFRKLSSLDTHVGAWLYRAPRPGQTEALERNKSLRETMNDAIDGNIDAYLREGLVSCLTYDEERLQRVAIARQREHALAVEQPTPPPRRPARLPGTLWGLTTYFNPSGYETKRENYRRFREASRAQGLHLLTVELAFEDRPFALSESDAERIIQLRSSEVLWHKERLLRLGLDRLPDECDKVAWLDADILFANPDWVAQTAEALESYSMVQPFSMSVRLDRNETWIDMDGLPVGSGEHEVLHGMALGVSRKGYECLGRYLDHGHSGYAWAGRRSILAKHGWYEANVLGNGDLNIALAMFGGADYVSQTRFSDKARRHLESWARAFHQDVQASVGWVQGTVYHLWHGNKRDRLYDVRLSVLKDHDFDPEHDLAYDENGVLRWAVDKPGLREWCKRYFDMRKER